MRRMNLVRCLPGREAALEARLAAVAALARAEPGCLAYDWYRMAASTAADAGARYAGISHWRSPAAFEAHLAGAAFRRFFDDERADACLAEASVHAQLVALTAEEEQP